MVDARGYSCPMPVIMVQKAVKNGAPDELEVMVDNQCSLENVTRFANNQGYSVTSSEVDGDFRLIFHLAEDDIIGLRLDTAGIDEDHGAAVPFDFVIDAVTGNAGRILHDGDALARNFVEQRGFTHVRAADDGYNRFRHLFFS